MTALGLDIGGANLKAAHTGGVACSRPFALWKRPGELPGELRSLTGSMPPADRWAVTMTGELCDCFATKREGVRHILNAVAEIAGSTPVSVWRNDGQFATLAMCLGDPLPAASANWLALATFAGRFVPDGPAVLIDIGSTTTDFVPLVNGKPVPEGRTDVERLRSKELIYTGIRRTPVCALLDPGEGMAEFFATMHDVNLVLGNVSDDAADCDTADGRPATREFAAARLARMLGGDSQTIGDSQIHRFAESIATRQSALLLDGVLTVAERLPDHRATAAILSGTGVTLALGIVKAYEQVCEKLVEIVDMREQLGENGSACACAVAVANLV